MSQNKQWRLTPSPRLLALIEAHGGQFPAARAWGLEYNSVKRFFSGNGGLAAESVASILEGTKLKYEDLFVHVLKGDEP